MCEEVEIRRMTKTDIDEVYEIEKLCFADPWSREAFEAELSGLNHCFYFVAVKDGILCGYMGIWHIVDEGHITNVAVHPDFRSLGIGQSLVEEVVSHGASKGLGAFTLEVRESNSVARRLYERCGFEAVGIRKRYYENKENAVIMWKYLENNR